MRIPVVLAVLAAAAILNAAGWWWPNRPVEIPPPPGGKIQSVSFAPFRDGQSPLTRVYPSRAEIEEDLRLLSRQVEGIRTYTSREGLEVVPEIARGLGMTVTAGAWIGPLRPNNEAEVEQLIRTANENRDVISRVIVGNEVLLRKDTDLPTLVSHIRRVKGAVSQPVGYADVWENFVRFPEIVGEVDYLVIHILPYWEDLPGGLAHMEDHVRWAYRQIRDRWPDKPVMIGETGWPTAGRSRGPSVPGLVNKATFVSRFVSLARSEGFDYNIIEAFDQRWKERLEGTMGAKWGLLSSDRAYKFDLAGPVSEDPRWPRHAAVAAVGGAALALVGLAGLGAGAMGITGLVILVAAAQLLASALVASGLVAARENFVPYQIAEAWTVWALQILVAAAAVRAMARRLAGPPPRLSTLLRGPLDPGLPGWEAALLRAGSTALLLLALWGLFCSVMLVVDGRYRNFQLPDLLVPTIAALALGAVRRRQRPADAPWWAAFGHGHLFAPSVPVPTGVPLGLGAAVRSAPLIALVAVGAPLAAAGVALREVVFQGLDAPAVLRVAEEVGLGMILTNGINREALMYVGVQVLLALPFLATLRHLRLGAARPLPEAGRDAARGWDSRT
ncbi:MAG: glycosyl hydrolase family 17 protein [Rhodospirillales bacterium]|jgi:exo-beta-1,3-glucanase (GH17 family)